ncbi:bactoprenol glucosyl transferase [Acidithiobacillus ferrivorans]|uniref:Bactoprenol glucosyl transferase n=1 Tax=Acidithiobacillus ferrivorans TaxID=160808 RepID=A0A060UUQ5_9PROT|nr:glycosyltransferase family 2 protein [Acidithiobacillus ferrivorans]MBN6739362.1 glycosyltransferase family 2 protein [Acidithiobacillus sp. MC6.1]OCB02065.1 bactoprenol glucosyl transferase [Acidithiobacillus ferrivorans]QQD73818.1 glycosyltransferase family 2 protein [Acidithiobacillus ferrivorans]CDQ12362.1 putative enzyme [Acidithiobacillus ferrivorans]SMH65096.1 bactoprenol glucosyl transferase [Acidithiobacillus ferrivorans]
MTVSIIIPCHNESGNLETLYTRIRAVMEQTGESWEMICVNDGSSDDTLLQLIALHSQDKRVKIIDLSRNFGKEAALTAGLDATLSDAAIPLDADLQDPPELIPELLAQWREGFDVVNAVRLSRTGESWLKRASAHVFYRIVNRMSEVEIPPDTGDFRLLSRPVLDALQALPERRRFMKGLFAWVGFRSTNIYYHRAPRHSGKTTWNYWQLWNFAVEGITSFSQVPLQLAAYLGFLVSLLAFLYAIWLIISTIVYGNPVKGYPSIMVTLLFLSGVQLMALGVIGEYLGRIYEESKQRPVYLVKQAWGMVNAPNTILADDIHK